MPDKIIRNARGEVIGRIEDDTAGSTSSYDEPAGLGTLLFLIPAGAVLMGAFVWLSIGFILYMVLAVGNPYDRAMRVGFAWAWYPAILVAVFAAIRLWASTLKKRDTWATVKWQLLAALGIAVAIAVFLVVGQLLKGAI